MHFPFQVFIIAIVTFPKSQNLTCLNMFHGRLDGRHVVFGKVLSGMDVLYKIEAEGSESGSPKRMVVILDSGELTS